MPTLVVSKDELSVLYALASRHAARQARAHGRVNARVVLPDSAGMQRLRNTEAALLDAENLAAKIKDEMTYQDRVDRWWRSRDRFFREQDRTRRYADDCNYPLFRAWAHAISTSQGREDVPPDADALESAEKAYWDSLEVAARWL